MEVKVQKRTLGLFAEPDSLADFCMKCAAAPIPFPAIVLSLRDEERHFINIYTILTEWSPSESLGTRRTSFARFLRML
jgi:hypothetical protein